MSSGWQRLAVLTLSAGAVCASPGQRRQGALVGPARRIGERKAPPQRLGQVELREERRAIGGHDPLKPRNLRRSDSRLDGTINLSGSNVFRGGTVSGTIDGQAVVLGVMVEGVAQATFSGKLSGQSISGEWDCPAVKDTGVWYGTLRPAAATP